MRVIRIDASSATILLTEAPSPKVRDRQTGEIAKDTVSGEALMTVGVVFIDEGESSLVQVTIPESGVTDGLTVGAGPRWAALRRREGCSFSAQHLRAEVEEGA